MPRPSEPLLQFLREAVRRKGLSTAELAERVGRERSDIKRALAGTDPLTVDDLVLLSQALQITPADLGLGAEAAPEEDGPIPLRLASSAPSAPEAVSSPTGADPFGNAAEQLVRSLFTLGLDFVLDCDTARLAESGIPPAVRAQNPTAMSLQFPARYHRHNEPTFEEESLSVRLSFDKIYRVAIPWAAVRGLRAVFPDETPSRPPPEAPKRPTLRVVK